MTITPIPVDALEIIKDIIMNNTTPQPVPGTNLFLGYTSTNDQMTGLVYALEDSRAADPLVTFGLVVATDVQMVDLIIYGNPGDYVTPKRECQRLRYVIASQGNYVYGGLRMLHARITGNVVSLGRDILNRQNFMTSFQVFLDPSYVET